MKEMWVESGMGEGSTVSYGCTPSFLARNSFLFVQSIGNFKLNENYFTRREGYNSFLLIFTIDGKGRAVYRERNYEMDRGTVLLMDCNDYQEYRTAEDSLWEFKWVHFNGGNSREYFKLIYENYGPLIRMPDNIVAEKLDSLMDLIKNSDRQMEIKASCVLIEILTEILLSNSPTNTGLSGESSHYTLVEGVLEFIERSYSTDISLRDLANQAHSSIYHFSRVFKKITGYSPYEYLVKFRINKAKTQLRITDNTVEEISRQTGFDSPSNFIRTFRELEGMTPLKYRNYWEG